MAKKKNLSCRVTAYSSLDELFQRQRGHISGLPTWTGYRPARVDGGFKEALLDGGPGWADIWFIFPWNHPFQL